MKELLAFIRKPESGGDYNIVYGGASMARLTSMTIGDVLKWQEAWRRKGTKSSAVGAYQFIYKTLRGLYAEAGLTINDRFSPENQDRLAIQLLKRRGLDKYQRREITTEEFANNLAKEWASLPVVTGGKKGRSYYAGDGLNKAHVDVEPFLQAVASVRVRPSIDTPPAVGERGGIFALLVAGALVAGLWLWRKIKGKRSENVD